MGWMSSVSSWEANGAALCDGRRQTVALPAMPQSLDGSIVPGLGQTVLPAVWLVIIVAVLQAVVLGQAWRRRSRNGGCAGHVWRSVWRGCRCRWELRCPGGSPGCRTRQLSWSLCSHRALDSATSAVGPGATHGGVLLQHAQLQGLGHHFLAQSHDVAIAVAAAVRCLGRLHDLEKRCVRATMWRAWTGQEGSQRQQAGSGHALTSAAAT